MSSIAYVCKCVIIQSPRHKEFNFEGDDYTATNDFENCVLWGDREVPDLSNEFFGVVDGLVIVFDGQVIYFCFCSKWQMYSYIYINIYIYIYIYIYI